MHAVEAVMMMMMIAAHWQVMMMMMMWLQVVDGSAEQVVLADIGGALVRRRRALATWRGGDVMRSDGSRGSCRCRHVPRLMMVMTRPRLLSRSRSCRGVVKQTQLVVHLRVRSSSSGSGGTRRMVVMMVASVVGTGHLASGASAAAIATASAVRRWRRRRGRRGWRRRRWGGRRAVEGLGGQIAQHSIDRRHARYVVLVADELVEQSVAYLPGEYWRTLALVRGDFVHDVRGGDARLAATDGARLYAARLVVAAEDFAHTPVGHLKHAADVAGARALMRQLDDLLTCAVGQRSTVDEDAAELVDAAVALRRLDRRVLATRGRQRRDHAHACVARMWVE